MLKALALSLSGLLLAGCPTPQPRQMAQVYIPAYDLGMSEGCPSGQNAAGNPWKRWTKDSNRYSWDAEYKQGWDDGFARCKGQYEAIGRAMR